VHSGHFQVPCGPRMAVRGERRQSIYDNLRYMSQRGAFYVRQTDSDILGSEYHPVDARTR